MAAAVRSTRPEDNLGLVYKVAHRYMRSALLPVGWEFDDLSSIGTVGLMKACDRFEPSRGLQFSTYAVPMIEGEIRRALRDTGPAGYRRRPESPPATVSLDAPFGDEEDRGWEDVLPDHNAADPQQEGDMADLRTALDMLPDANAAVVRMYFFDGLTETEIAGRVGLSQAQVSRRLHAGMGFLREMLESQERGDLDMGKHGGWNALPIDKAAVRRWAGEGLDRDEIAARLRITTKQLVAWCHNHHVPLPPMAGEAATATTPARALVDVTIKADASETRVTPSAPEAPAETSQETHHDLIAEYLAPDVPPAAAEPLATSPYRRREREGGIVLPIRVEGARGVVGDPEVEGDITDVEVAVAARKIRQRLAALSGEGGAA